MEKQAVRVDQLDGLFAEQSGQKEEPRERRGPKHFNDGSHIARSKAANRKKNKRARASRKANR